MVTVMFEDSPRWNYPTPQQMRKVKNHKCTGSQFLHICLKTNAKYQIKQMCSSYLPLLPHMNFNADFNVQLEDILLLNIPWFYTHLFRPSLPCLSIQVCGLKNTQSNVYLYHVYTFFSTWRYFLSMCSSRSSYGAMLLSTDIIETLNGDLKRLPLIILLALSSQLLSLFRSWPACTHACIGWKSSLDRIGYVFWYATIKYFPVSCTCRSGFLLVRSKFC